MADVSTDPRKYLDPKTLVKIGRLDLVARLVVEGFVTGLHKSPFHGFSVEFAEHREYVPGDDVRHIDWKVYGKSDRYYIKQYEEETNLTAYVILDVSESMDFGSKDAAQLGRNPQQVTKLQYGQFMSAALAHLILRQQDSIGLVTFDTAVKRFVPPSAQPSQLKVLTHELEQVDATEKKTNLGDVLHELAERIKRRALIIIISDLFDEPDSLLMGLRHLRHKRHEVICFHLMDHLERTFPFDRMTKFEGLEGAGDVVANPAALRKAYLEELEKFVTQVKKGCRADRIDYVGIDTKTPLDVSLTSYLATRSEMGLK